MRIAALAGGVGGAKLADGLLRVVGESLTVIVNTGDDFELHGLHISPDLDTVTYTLAGIANPDTGWGIAGDTFACLGMLARYGAEDWFGLGDRDLAAHILRTAWLRQGRALSEVTSHLASALGVPAAILPMSDETVSTMVDTDAGELTFQEYFVRRRWQPIIRSVRFAGIEHAHPQARAVEAIERADLIVLCPSNPFVSIQPILSVPGMLECIREAGGYKLAVSPIVGGEALKGPAAKMFREVGVEPSAVQVAKRYRDWMDGFVLDQADANLAGDVAELGMDVLITNTIMRTVEDREQLAREITSWASELAAH